MAIVPTHKGDIETCRALGSASDEEVCGHLGELLIWLQDMNWPVAPLIVRRLKTLGAPLVEPIREILKGTDDIWKYWIVSVLLPGVDASVRNSLMGDLPPRAVKSMKSWLKSLKGSSARVENEVPFASGRMADAAACHSTQTLGLKQNLEICLIRREG